MLNFDYDDPQTKELKYPRHSLLLSLVNFNRTGHDVYENGQLVLYENPQGKKSLKLVHGLPGDFVKTA